MFSLGAQNWTPFQQLEFAAKWNVEVVHTQPGERRIEHPLDAGIPGEGVKGTAGG